MNNEFSKPNHSVLPCLSGFSESITCVGRQSLNPLLFSGFPQDWSAIHVNLRLPILQLLLWVFILINNLLTENGAPSYCS